MFVNFNTTNLDDEYINNLDMVPTSEIVEAVDKGFVKELKLMIDEK